jgi:tetratricopeptide (TPR) repeat protein
MRCVFSVALIVSLVVAMNAGAIEIADQGIQASVSPPDSTAQAGVDVTAVQPATGTPSVTVTGQTPRNEPTLPKLPPDQFTDCYAKYSSTGPELLDFVAMTKCQLELARDVRIVIDKCVNLDKKNTPPSAIQACTELLEHNTLQGRDRLYLFVNRALAFLAQGDKQHALDDYNGAVQAAPKMALPYYYRGVFYAKTDVEAALKDLDTALSINPKLVSAIRQRAIIHLSQKNLSSALADYSQAVRLSPKTAALWSERGYVSILDRDYASAVKDEGEAIRLDPKLARAYFLRGAALGDLGDSVNAVGDIRIAVDLDPSLDRYISTQGKTASIALPPL